MLFTIKYILFDFIINSIDFYTKIFFHTQNGAMWMGGVTRMDRIWNAYITRSLCATNVVEKIRENITRRFGHIEKRNN